MNKTRLKKYARLIATKGVNVQCGQEVMITAELEEPEFVKMLVEECYKCGAKKVSVDWTYQPLEKLAIKYQKETVLSTFDNWQIEKWKHQAEVLPAKIFLTSSDPDGLRGVDQKKANRAKAAKSIAIKPIRRSLEIVLRPICTNLPITSSAPSPS